MKLLGDLIQAIQESWFSGQTFNTLDIGPALSKRGNLAHARARGAGPPRTVKHRYLPGLGRYKTLMMRAKE